MPNVNDERRLLAAAELASRSLADFCIAMDHKWSPAWFHEKICSALEAVERGDITRLIITMPPRHGKSLLTSVYFPSWFLGRNPDAQVITTSYSADLAQDFGSKARDIVGSDAYQLVFPKARLRSDTAAKDKWAFSKGGSYTAVGVGGPITGRGADLLLLDDVFKNREEADSKLIRDKIFSWYTSTAYTRLMPGGRIVMLMTRWSTDDLIGRLLKNPTEPWTVINFPAIAMQSDENRKIGDALWPEKYPIHVLERTRAALGPMDWGSLYQQTPLLSEFQEFKPEYIKTYDPALKGFDSGQYNIYTGVDLAISKKDGADYTAIVTYAKDRFTGDAYLLDVIRDRLDPLETIEAIFSVYAKYRPSKIGIETTAYQQSIIYFMDAEMKRRKIFPFIVPITHSTNKEARIRRIQPYYRTGQVYHPKIETEGTRALNDEMFSFPKGGHDDVLDAAATAFELFDTTEAKPQPRGMNIYGADPYAANGEYGGGNNGDGPPDAWSI